MIALQRRLGSRFLDAPCSGAVNSEIRVGSKHPDCVHARTGGAANQPSSANDLEWPPQQCVRRPGQWPHHVGATTANDPETNVPID